MRLLLCLGATKAGTSWLFRQLRWHPETAFRSLKEIHYFEDAGSGSHEGRRAQYLAEAEAAETRRRRTLLPWRRRHLAARSRLLREVAALRYRPGGPHDAYLDLLTARGRGRIVGDFTPAYGQLEPGTLAEAMRVTGDVRAVFLMRAPVARLWSHVRMIAARRPPEERAAAAGRILEKAVTGLRPDILAAGDYAGMLPRLRAAIPPGRLLVMFHEEAVTQPGFERITDHFGLARHPADTGTRIHAGEARDLDPGWRRRAAVRLLPQYDAVAEITGEPLPPAWVAEYDLTERARAASRRKARPETAKEGQR